MGDARAQMEVLSYDAQTSKVLVRVDTLENVVCQWLRVEDVAVMDREGVLRVMTRHYAAEWQDENMGKVGALQVLGEICGNSVDATPPASPREMECPNAPLKGRPVRVARA